MSMRRITFLQPNRLTFGTGALRDALDHLKALPYGRVHVVSSPILQALVDEIVGELSDAGKTVSTDATVTAEPTLAMFHDAVTKARTSLASLDYTGVRFHAWRLRPSPYSAYSKTIPARSLKPTRSASISNAFEAE